MSNDTSYKVEQIYINKLKQKTDIERALMGFSMFETSRNIVRASLKPLVAKEKDMKIAIFNRFYGNDFTTHRKEAIIKYLTSGAGL